MIDQIQSHYDNDYTAEGLSEWRGLGAIGKAANIVALCNPFPHSTIVDIGCGDGAFLKELEALNFGDSLYGLEISRSGLKALHQKRVENLVDARKFDGYNIPYPDDHFDLAVLSYVVEHVENPLQLIAEAARVA
ncbi:MAG: class I SAM-dependent methyltransferase [Bacteroidetes bacterium]|nr:class I SAM-dependent methyltransferase [Bacteroidota bacterium]